MTFEEFYKLKFKTSYAFFYNKDVGTGFIDDLVQESFLRFHDKYLDKLQKPNEASKIFFGICLNVYRDWIKDRVKNGIYINKEIASEDEEEMFEIDDDPEIEEKKKLVLEALNKLNEKTRQIIILRFFEGKSREEVANVLNMKPKDVHTYQKRGIAKLQKVIDIKELKLMLFLIFT